jgi:RNA polymerase sigma-70 factor (ECF subfamily)
MDDPASQEFTTWLQDWANGDRGAFDRLMPVVYRELRNLAARYMRNERPGHTLTPTALIHEAYIRLVSQSVPEFRNRSHFFGVAAQVMRQILVENARAFRAEKRGTVRKLPLHEIGDRAAAAPDPDVVEVDEALRALERLDERKARAVEMQYFGGLSVEEIAEALQVSTRTAARELRAAKAALLREMARR